jgi:hypothetical protein
MKFVELVFINVYGADKKSGKNAFFNLLLNMEQGGIDYVLE